MVKALIDSMNYHSTLLRHSLPDPNLLSPLSDNVPALLVNLDKVGFHDREYCSYMIGQTVAYCETVSTRPRIHSFYVLKRDFCAIQF